MGILTNGLNLLGCLYTVLHLTEFLQVVSLFLGNLAFHGGNLLVLGLGHCLGGSLQSFAGYLQLRAYPAARRDAHGQCNDTGQFHDIHRPASKHHQPALIGTYTKSQQQAEDTGIADGITEDGGFRERLHRHQKLVKALIDAWQSHCQEQVGDAE